MLFRALTRAGTGGFVASAAVRLYPSPTGSSTRFVTAGGRPFLRGLGSKLGRCLSVASAVSTKYTVRLGLVASAAFQPRREKTCATQSPWHPAASTSYYRPALASWLPLRSSVAYIFACTGARIGGVVRTHRIAHVLAIAVDLIAAGPLGPKI